MCEKNTQYWNLFKKYIAETHCQNIILISDLFGHLAGHQNKESIMNFLKDYFLDYDVKIICYLRDLASFLPSSYNQAVKQSGTCLSFRESITRLAQNGSLGVQPNRILNVFADTFGKESLIIKKYDKNSLLNGDIIADFCNTIECDIEIKHKITDENISLPSSYITLKRILNRCNIPNIKLWGNLHSSGALSKRFYDSIARDNTTETISEETYDILKQNAQKVLDDWGVDISKNLENLKTKTFPTISPEAHFSTLLSGFILEKNQEILNALNENEKNNKNLLNTINELKENEKKNKNTLQVLEEKLNTLISINNNFEALYNINTKKMQNIFVQETNKIDNKLYDVQNSINELQQKTSTIQQHLTLLNRNSSSYQAIKNIALQPFLKKKAFLLCNTNQLLEAENLAQSIIANNPYMAWAYYILGRVQRKRKELDLALENYEKAINLEPSAEYFVKEREACLAERERERERERTKAKIIMFEQSLYNRYLLVA